MTQEELDLLHGWMDGTIREEEMPRLQVLLRESAEARRTLRGLSTVEVKLQELASANPVTAKLLSFQPEPARARSVWNQPLAWAAALALLCAAGAWVWPRGGKEVPVAVAEQTENGCAVVAQVHGESELRAGTILKPGALHLPGGLVRLEFFSGASVLLEGEADLEIKSAWEAACVRGKARVTVPPPAEGFRLSAPGLNLVDIGTEFGVTVDAGGVAEVHVFEGKVQAHPEGGAARMVTGGESLRRDGAGVLLADLARPALFTSARQLDALVNGRAETRYEGWRQWSSQARSDSRLIAYYAFEHAEADPWDRLVHNAALAGGEQRTGAAVGARWSHGRWPMKSAIEFKGAGDRVRLHLGDETYDAITLTCWACVEGLDRKYNALLLTDGYDPGEPHWQIYEDGRLMFSIAYADPAAAQTGKKQLNQIYFSPPVFNLTNQGRWHQLTVTYDNQSGAAIQYVDGREISREVSPYHRAGRPIHFGPAEIGNWGLPTEGHKFPIRNLNGRIDEFAIYRAALSAAEIAQAYEAGEPE